MPRARPQILGQGFSPGSFWGGAFGDIWVSRLGWGPGLLLHTVPLAESSVLQSAQAETGSPGLDGLEVGGPRLESPPVRQMLQVVGAASLSRAHGCEYACVCLCVYTCVVCACVCMGCGMHARVCVCVPVWVWCVHVANVSSNCLSLKFTLSFY